MADINLTAEQVAALILSIGDKSKLKTADKQTIVDAINEVIDSNLAPTSVLYTPMNLSDESKAQARENIGAVSTEAVPLYIRGTYDAQANTFTPETDYTVQEISDAVSAGRYVALVVGGEYIVPCVECTRTYCMFSLLQTADILNITDNYINIRISRRSGDWAVDAFQIT